MEATDQLKKNTVTPHAAKQNPKKPKLTCHHCRKPCHYRNQCLQLKCEKPQWEGIKDSAGNNMINNNSGQTNIHPNNKNAKDIKNQNASKQMTGNQELFTRPMRPV